MAQRPLWRGLALLAVLTACSAGCGNDIPEERLLEAATERFRTDERAAVRIVRHLANRGYAPAQVAMGNLHQRGRLTSTLYHETRTEPDSVAQAWFARAFNSFRAAADSGDALAGRMAAVMQRKGIGTPADLSGARMRMLSAARDGDSLAYFLYGRWSTEAGDTAAAVHAAREAIARRVAQGHILEAHLAMCCGGSEPDIRAYVGALRKARDLGMREAARGLRLLYIQVNEAAERGETEARRTRDRLMEAGLWETPRPRRSRGARSSA